MGSVLSLLISWARVSGGGGEMSWMGELPEDCAAAVLRHMRAPEICKMALLNRAFSRAAKADFVWESKLPENYDYLLRYLFHQIPHTKLPKKQIYALLSRPNSFDSGRKEVWLEKSTGRLCLSISSTALSITGIDDRRYWNHIPTNESRFQTVAYLQQIWWFEVGGKIEFQFPSGRYSIFFRLQLGKAAKRFGHRVCNLEHVHGWDRKPVRFHFSTSDGQRAQSQCYLRDPGKWIHYHAGDFVVENSYLATTVSFSVTQIDCTHTKGGLCVDSMVIYPTELCEKGNFF